ncbi:MAG TPA: hypothetical protein PKH16_04770 [Aequorivita sp.]|jgi:hypothetical protein|nr:hypothetical protein [Aequorivita sp.]|tara:strand:+ start:276 stop:446 length:171 start_codon:yes stop_codon:yes gene_type:complete
MKKIILVLLTVFLNLGLFSCTPQAISEEVKSTQACCGDDGHIPPPPPPPVGGNGGG